MSIKGITHLEKAYGKSWKNMEKLEIDRRASTNDTGS